MFRSILALLAAVRVFLRSRHDTALEVLALRQQVAVLKRKRPRPGLNPWDRLFWVALRHLWPRWAEVLVIVKPDTVVGWKSVYMFCTNGLRFLRMRRFLRLRFQ